MTQPSNLYRPTRHATVRAQQRGVSAAVLTHVFRFGDLELPAGGGCCSLEISADMALSLMSDGLPIDEIEAARRVVLIVGERGAIVTVMRRNAPSIRARESRGRRPPTRSRRRGV